MIATFWLRIRGDCCYSTTSMAITDNNSSTQRATSVFTGRYISSSDLLQTYEKSMLEYYVLGNAMVFCFILWIKEQRPGQGDCKIKIMMTECKNLQMVEEDWDPFICSEMVAFESESCGFSLVTWLVQCDYSSEIQE